MKKKVTIVDDTPRHNVCQRVTTKMQLDYLKRFGVKLPVPVGRFIPVKDRHGKQVQEVVQSKHVFEGPRLEHAIRRAKRWMRSGKFPAVGAPHHIAMFMAAFHKADPKGFKLATS